MRDAFASVRARLVYNGEFKGRFGHLFVFFGRMIPTIRSVISIPAGFLRMGGVNHDAAPVTVPSLAPRGVYSTWALNPADGSAWTSVTLPAEVGILSA